MTMSFSGTSNYEPASTSDTPNATSGKPDAAHVARKDLASRLVAAREAQELTTSQLARRLGVRTSTLRNWEHGNSEPRSNRLLTLAGVLSVPVSWLITGDDAMEPALLGSPHTGMLAQKLVRAQRLHADLGQLLGEIANDFAVLKQGQN